MNATDLDELESELGVSSSHLRQYIEKIEKLEEEKSELQEHVKETFSQAKNDGFDVKIMRKILTMRKMKKEELMEQQELLEIYAKALGMVI